MVSLGNSSTETIRGYVNFTATSDKRFKRNIKEDVSGLEFITRLRPVTYSYNVDAIEAFYGRVVPEALREAADKKNHTRVTGFIAQEVEAAAKESDFDFSGVDAPNDDEDHYGLRYAEFVVPLVKATQELNALVSSSEQELASMKDPVKKQGTVLEQMKADLAKLEVQISSNSATGQKN